MQRLREDDLSGHVLEQGGYVHICLPMRYEPKRMVETPLGWTDPRKEDGELLAPKQFPDDKLKKVERSLGSYGVAGQMQQRPAPAEGGILKAAWWRYYDVRPETYDELIQSWDLTFKDASTSDYVSGQVWGRIGPNVFLVDWVWAKMDAPTVIRAILALSAKWPKALLKLIEDTANGPAVIALLRDKVQGLVPVPARGSKDSRVQAIAPLIEAGNVYLPSPTLDPRVNGFVLECSSFPNGTYDDQVDAMSQALNRLRLSIDGMWDALPVSITKAELGQPTPPVINTVKPHPSKGTPELITGSRKGRMGW